MPPTSRRAYHKYTSARPVGALWIYYVFFFYRLGVYDGLKAFGHRNVRPRQKQYDNIIIRIDYYYVYIILLFRPVAICNIYPSKRVVIVFDFDCLRFFRVHCTLYRGTMYKFEPE